MTQPNQTGMIKKQKASVAVKEQPTTIKDGSNHTRAK